MKERRGRERWREKWREREGGEGGREGNLYTPHLSAAHSQPTDELACSETHQYDNNMTQSVTLLALNSTVQQQQVTRHTHTSLVMDG